MQKKQQLAAQRLHDVQRFLYDNREALATIAGSGAWRKLDALVSTLHAHDTVKTETLRSAQSATTSARSLAEALHRDLLSPMVRIAKDELPTVPELRPLGVIQQRISTLRIASDARGMAMAAEPYRDIFTTAGLPADFIERISTAADTIGAAVTERNARQARSTGAGKGVHTTLLAGSRIVHVLDAFIRSVARGNPTLLAAWHRARRIRTRAASAPAIVVPESNAA